MSKLLAKKPEATGSEKTKGLIFSESGVGKTWFVTAFPNPYFIDTEGGAKLEHYLSRIRKAGGAYLGPEDGSLDFKTVIDQMQALATEEHTYKTLIIDSITKLYQVAIANEAERLGDKDAFGASKKPAIHNMRRLVNWAMRLDMNVWFVAHETAQWGTVNGQRTEVGRVPDVWDKLIYELDLALWAQKRGQSRMAVVKKSRLVSFPEGEQFPLDYAEFANRYGKEIIEAPVKQITLASTDQVAEVDGLIKAVRVTEEEIEKWFTKAGVSSFAEMSSETINKVIAFLKAKVK